ncbi:MAG: GNAT family N-acetyltransferase [Gammaproteobacteria bacterium]
MIPDVVADDAGLAALWPDWASLWRSAPGASPFLSPAWLRPWWNVFGNGRPVVAGLRRAGRLLGLLPLYRLEGKLLPIGVGISDYHDALIAPDAPPDTASRLLAAALHATDAERCDLPDLPEGAWLRDVAAPPGWAARDWACLPCPVLSLVPEPAIPKTMRRDIRQARHRAERAGGWSVQRADAAGFPALLDALIRLHQARWTGRGEEGVLADPRVQDFHRAAGPALLEDGLLRLEALHLRGRIAAVTYALLAERRICFYLGGFDPALGFESPGTILMAHMIEEAAREGRQEADFLRGGERYKYAWGGVDRMNLGRSFVRA